MDQKIKALFKPALLHKLARRFDLDARSLKVLDGFESFIYEASRSGSDYILRVSSSIRRPEAMLRGEIEWINYLAAGGVPVARAVLSSNAVFIEKQVVPHANSCFYAVLFEKAPGTYASKKDWTVDLFKRMGHIMGSMHRLTKDFTFNDTCAYRPHWFEETAGFARRYLPKTLSSIVDKHEHHMDLLKNLPRDKESYGLVHFDFHAGNFYLDHNGLTLFDFDDCQYAWFAYDIAIALFYAVPFTLSKQEQHDRIDRFLGPFLDGYARENKFEADWLTYLPAFLKDREIDLFVCIHRSFDPARLDPWSAGFMNNRTERILHDIPVFDYDFTKLA